MDEPTKCAEPNSPLDILLVGDREEDFFIIRDLLSRTQGAAQAQLEHAASFDEALAYVARKSYDLVLVEYDAEGKTALRLMQEMRCRDIVAPVMVLAEDADETTVAKIIQAGACDFVPKSGLNEASLARPMRCAVNLHCKEGQRQDAEKMLRKLSRAVEQSADLVIITDRNGVIEYVNPAFEKLTGYTRQEAVGQNPRILKSGQQSKALYQDLWTTILSGKVFRGTLVNRKKNGELFYLEKTISPVRDAHGAITHFISTDRDITERYKLEAQLRQAQKMDAVGQLAGGVAHDFNNLLMVISSYAELMLNAIVPSHNLHHNVKEIIDAARRAADLTRQLLAFSRKQMQDLQILDLNHVIADIAKILGRVIGEDIQLTVLPGEKLGRVKADPVQVEQVVMNLATNARDAMPNGGKLTIETSNVNLDEAYVQEHSIVPPGDYVLLAVSDSGRGIQPEHLAHIFEPFFTTKEKGKGTGLGLATVYGIVKQNGGFIWVYSEPGLGTTFKIYLPQVGHAIDRAVVRHFPEISVQGWETVLLVEDEEAVRRAACEFLTLCGYKVLEAKDGQHGIQVARSYSGPIHLMITDVVMPHMSGSQLAQQLTLERPSMRVMFVSGYAEKTILQHGVLESSAKFLQKPFTLKALGQKIRAVLQADPVEIASS